MTKFLEQSADLSVLAAPAVTTLSGRQAQIQVVELKNIVSDSGSSDSGTIGMKAVPLGPSLDVVPYVDADGVSIHLTLLPQLTEFLGYDEPTRAQLAAAPPGTTVPLPRIRTRQTICHVTAGDGETVVIADLGPARASARNSGSSNMKRLVLFVTPRLIDSAGDPIHPE